MRKPACGLCVLLLGTAPLAAQSYSMSWYTLDGGGGASTGAVYTVRGTIGQPDTARLSGGDFSLSGGFWGAVGIVPTPGAPLLRVFRTTTNTVVIAWCDPESQFTLQHNAVLHASGWSNVLSSPILVGEEKQLVVYPAVAGGFYRLKSRP